MQVIGLRVDLLEREPLKEEEQRLELGVAEAVEFACAEVEVEFAVAAGVEIEVELRKDAEAAYTSIGIEILRRSQRGGGRECEGVIEQCCVNLGCGFLAYLRDRRLANAIPIL